MTTQSQAMLAAFAALAMASAAQAQFRVPGQPVQAQFQSLASDLTVQYVTRNAGEDLDMLQFLPIGSANPTHIIACIEENRSSLDGSAPPFQFGDKLNPGVQRINITPGPSFGQVETIVRGMQICDGIRTTPWGTVVATEEDFANDTGSAYEILDPFTTDVYTILDRGIGGTAATIVDQNGIDPVADGRIAKRVQLPVVRWEGFLVHETGTLILGDEERPGSYRFDSDGGAIFKWIPDSPRVPGSGFITQLSQSPLAGPGKTYAASVTCTNGTQPGQGCEVGRLNWVLLAPQAAEVGDNVNVLPRIGREAANDAGATGYYRPEDLHMDPNFNPTAAGFGPNAIRFCFANTGNAGSEQYGEVICGVDFNIASVSPTAHDGTLVRWLEGDKDLNQPDNLEFQVGTGILYVIEDNPNSDIWACLPDGADRDLKSDGCVRVLRLNDTSAETTGFAFLPNGTQAIFNIQHSNDNAMPLFDDFRTDDLILVSGFGAASPIDWGARTEALLERSSKRLFGFTTP